MSTLHPMTFLEESVYVSTYVLTFERLRLEHRNITMAPPIDFLKIGRLAIAAASQAVASHRDAYESLSEKAT